MSKTKTRKRQPSKSEQARRKRQSPYERAASVRNANRRSRARQSWESKTGALLVDYETGKRILDNDPDFADMLFAEQACLPDKQRGEPPVTVMEGGQRQAKSGDVVVESRSRHTDTSTPDTSELDGVVDVSMHRAPPLPEREDLPALETQAIKDLAYVKAVMAWKEPKNSKPNSSICAHSSWLMFDGYALGTLWPNGLPLPVVVDEPHSLLRRPVPGPYPWPGRLDAAQMVTVHQSYGTVIKSGIVSGPYGMIAVNETSRPQGAAHYHANWAEWK